MMLRSVLTVFAFSLCLFAHAQSMERDNVVGSTFSFQSETMQDEREIQVFLPDGYKDSGKNYPVLYILDGQRYFLHGVSLQKSFVEFKQTPEFIVVGIPKAKSDRNTIFSVDSQKYLAFIEREVVSFMDKRFRTTKERLLFGWAYGGGFVVEAMLTEPALFDGYFAASPFPLQDRIKKADSLFTENQDFDRFLFFSSGTDEGVVKEETAALNLFLRKKAPESMNWTFKELEGEEHRSTPFTTLYHGIKTYFSYYPELQFNSLGEFLGAGGLDYVTDYYEKRALKFGFSNELSDWTMFSLTRNAIRAGNFEQFGLLESGFRKTGFIERLRVNRSCVIAEFYLSNDQYDTAIELFLLIAEKHPHAERPLNGLGNTYQELKEEEKATLYFNKAKDLTEDESN